VFAGEWAAAVELLAVQMGLTHDPESRLAKIKEKKSVSK
jgi:hypothetical protein